MPVAMKLYLGKNKKIFKAHPDHLLISSVSHSYGYDIILQKKHSSFLSIIFVFNHRRTF